MGKIKALKPQQDAFGQMIWARYKGEEVFEVVERDDGYIDAIDSKGYFSEYKDWSLIEQKAIRLVKEKFWISVVELADIRYICRRKVLMSLASTFLPL
jgi:hypothetical protein